LSETDFDEVLRVNVKGPWLALKALFRCSAGGAMSVTTPRSSAHLGMPGSGAYAASKAALRSFAADRRIRTGERAIRVNAVSRGRPIRES